MKEYEERIVEEICKECNFAERIIVRLFKRICIKSYLKGHIDTFNNINL